MSAHRSGRARNPRTDVYDVAVVGAGIVGAALARELSGHELTVALVEARADVGDGTSSEANGYEHCRLVDADEVYRHGPAHQPPGRPAPARGRLLLWTDSFVRLPKVTVRQDGRTVARRTLAWPAAPGRVFRVPAGLLDGVSTTGGPVRIGLDGARSGA